MTVSTDYSSSRVPAGGTIYPTQTVSVSATPTSSAAQRFAQDYFTQPLKRNNAVETAALDNTSVIKTATQSTAPHVRAQVKEKFGLDVDPEKTHLVTIAYNRYLDTPPHQGYIVQKLSLADAARLNVQDTPLPGNFHGKKQTPHDRKPSFVISHDSKHNEAPQKDGTFGLPNNHTAISYYQGIYTEPSPSAPDSYSADNQVPILAKDFKKLTWEHAYKKPHDLDLKFHWDHNDTREKYSQLSKLNYLTVAHAQHHEQSISQADLEISNRVAGLPVEGNFADLRAPDLKAPYPQDPNLETKFLNFNGFASNDIFYSRDTTTGRTLLHIPGGSPPLHGFDSPQAMNKWLGSQMADPVKAGELKSHFRVDDRADVSRSRGLDTRWNLIQNQLSSRDSTDHYERQGWWEEGGVFSGQKIQGNPFNEVQRRVEKESYSRSDHDFVLNSDHTKKHVVKGLHILNAGLTLLAPLGIALPPVGAVITGIKVASGALETAIGIDDVKNDRPGGAARVVAGAIVLAKEAFSAGTSKITEPVKTPLKAAAKTFYNEKVEPSIFIKP